MSTKTRLWVLVTGILCALVVLYGVMMGLMPQLQQAAQIRSESDTTEFLIETQQTQLARLQQADREKVSLQRQLTELEVSIPTDPDWAEFLRELQGISVASGAITTQITAADAVLPESAAPPAGVEVGAADLADGEADAGATATDPAASQVPATNLIMIPVTITVEGDESQIWEFVRQLQDGGRLFTASTVEFDGTSETLTGTITGAIYVTP